MKLSQVSFPIFSIILSRLRFLAILWYFHHQQFRHLAGLNRTLLVTTMTSLAFVCLVPFSTNIAGDYPYDVLGAIIFELDIFVIGLITIAQWYYLRNRSAVLLPGLPIDGSTGRLPGAGYFPFSPLPGSQSPLPASAGAPRCTSSPR